MGRARRIVGFLLRGLLIAGVLALGGYFFFDQIALLALEASVAGRPHATIEIVAFDERGHLMGSVGFFRSWRPALIVRDRAGAATFGMQYGLGVPRIAIPPGEPVSFELLWPVPGFGKVLMMVDNGGAGFRVSSGADIRVELAPELARSRLGQVVRWIERHNHGHPASAEQARLASR